ncbi:hypothetical protein B0H10DRAFT_1969362 [Mycena sp. CBHHK59/15]|nr:hypothetical protein B0H10DRAFT_1969362 [Mycena sp. CBHHK59/15]
MAQASGPGLGWLAPGFGPGLGFPKPKPDEAKPKPWFLGQAKPAKQGTNQIRHSQAQTRVASRNTLTKILPVWSGPSEMRHSRICTSPLLKLLSECVRFLVGLYPEKYGKHYTANGSSGSHRLERSCAPRARTGWYLPSCRLDIGRRSKWIHDGASFPGDQLRSQAGCTLQANMGIIGQFI